MDAFGCCRLTARIRQRAARHRQSRAFSAALERCGGRRLGVGALFDCRAVIAGLTGSVLAGVSTAGACAERVRLFDRHRGRFGALVVEEACESCRSAGPLRRDLPSPAVAGRRERSEWRRLKSTSADPRTRRLRPGTGAKHERSATGEPLMFAMKSPHEWAFGWLTPHVAERGNAARVAVQGGRSCRAAGMTGARRSRTARAGSRFRGYLPAGPQLAWLTATLRPARWSVRGRSLRRGNFRERIQDDGTKPVKAGRIAAARQIAPTRQDLQGVPTTEMRSCRSRRSWERAFPRCLRTSRR